MELTTYVHRVRRELAVAAEAGGEDARLLAERLTAPLESAIRLTLLDALSAAADEITRDLAPGSVELRLRGGDPSFVVTPPPADRSFDRGAEGGHVESGDPAPHPDSTPADLPGPQDGPTSRINVRLPDTLKTKVEEAASREGRSVNAWLIRAATAALQRPRPGQSVQRSPRGGARGAQSYTGWVQ
ncbi:MAG TPA: Arc family DNA-binding protein [Nocardioidaceae bacterium]|nr:Arc family DNA-binding protein [Nocardioidaceae bacterium]